MSVFVAIAKELQSERDACARTILDGRVADFAAYRELSGQVKAYDRAIAIVRNIAKKYEESDDVF